VAGAEGDLVEIINTGATNILVLKDQSSSSTAANRFLFGADVSIGTNKAIVLRYDATTARWARLRSRAGQHRCYGGLSYGSATPMRLIHCRYSGASLRGLRGDMRAGLGIDHRHADDDCRLRIN